MLAWQIIVFSYFPCMIAAAYTGPAWLGVRLNARIAVFAGISASILDLLARKMFIPLGIPPGWDMPVMILILAAVLKIYSRKPWLVLLSGSLFSYILISAGDSLVMPQVLKLLGMSIEQVVGNPWLAAAVGNSSSLIIYLAGLLAGLGKFKVVDLTQVMVHSK